MPSNKKISVDVGVNFKAEGQQLEQYVNRVKESINAMQGSGGKNSNAFAGTSKALDSLITEYEKLAKMKLNTDNVGDYIRQQDKLRQAIVAVNQAASKESSDLTAKQAKYNATIDTAKQKQEKLLEAIGKAKAENNSAEVEKLTRSYNAQKGVITRAENGLKALNTESERQKQILNGVNTAVNQANNSLRENAKVYEEAAKAEAEANRQETIDSIKQKIKYYTSLAFGVQLVRRALRETIETYKELDASITSISMVSGLSRDTLWGQIGTYNDLAKELGTTTGEVLNAAQLYYQQGRDTNSVIELTTESLKLAAIAGLDTAEATNYLTAAVNGYKMEAADAGEVTDVWAQLAAKNAVSVDELAVSISKVASIAQSAGMDIQSTSAFLTQMIATTREAPENLGTALKTIIARFQELKTSGAALEDGVDANKVEKALKTVGISLRDTTGQFRDFDDVILELSSKWDSLDRNTQRYIATIAAGSRQQSRFIALVSDYEGLTEIMEQAADAQGAASEQFEVYTEGLQASLNRLKASWEGFYTSISKGQNLITNIIDLISKVVDGFSKIGVTGTAIVLGLGAKITSTLTSVSKIMKAGKGTVNFLSALKQTTPFLTQFIDNLNKMAPKELTGTLGNIVNMSKVAGPAFDAAATSVTGLTFSFSSLIGPLTIISGLIVAIAGAYQLYKKWEKKPEEWKEEAQNSQQVAKRYEEYADSIEEAVKAGKDWSDIRERLLAEDDEFLKGIDAENASTQELIQSLRERQKEEELLAITKKAASQQETYSRNVAKEASPRGSSRNYATGNAELTNVNKALEADKINSSTARDMAENVEDLFGNISTGGLEATEVVDSLTIAFQRMGAVFDSEGNLIASSFDIQKYINTIKNAEPEVQEAFRQLTSGEKTWTELPGEIQGALTSAFSDAGFGSVIDFYQKTGIQLAKNIEDGFDIAVSNTDNGLTKALLRGFQNNQELSNTIKSKIEEAFNDIDTDDPAMQDSFADYIRKIIDIDPSLLTEELINAFGNMDFESVYAQMLRVDEDDLNVELLEYFKDIIGETTAAFIEGKQAVDDYNSTLATLDNLTSGASLDEYSDSIWALSADWQELGYESRQAMLEQLWANTVIDESGQYMQAESDLLAELRNQYDLTSAEARKNAIQSIQAEKEKVDAKIAEIEAELERRGVTIESAKDQLKAIQEQEKGGMQAAVAGHKAASQAVQKHGATVNNFIHRILNPIRSLAKSVGLDLGGVELEDFSAIENEAIETIMQADVTVQSNAALAAMHQRLQGISDDLARQAHEIDWYQSEAEQKAGSGGGRGSGSKGSSNSTKVEKESDRMKKALDKLKDKVDELKDAAKDAADAAKAELEAITDRLKKQKKEIQDEIDKRQKLLKAAQEEAKWRAEVWVEYLQGRLNDLKDELDKEKDLLDQNNDDLNNVAKAYQDAYDLQIDGIQAKIDALDKEAEAEDRLRKLQEARDAYERSRNQRTRLVLTQGAGWIFKTDTEALNQARDGLKDAQRDYQKAVLQDEIDKIQEQKDKWAEVAENIGKSAEELAAYKKALEDAFAVLESGAGDDKLVEFANKVSANNQRVDFVNGLEEEYNKQSNEKEEGSIAQQIADLQKEIDKIGWNLDDFREAAKKEEYKNELLEASNRDVSQLGQTTNTILHGIDDFVNGYLYDSLSQIKSWEDQIDAIDELVDQYNDLKDRIGKSTEELTKQQVLTDHYGKLTNEQLGENSESWNKLLKMIEASNKAQDEYEKKQLEYGEAQKAYNAQKEKEDAAEAAASATPGGPSGGSGSGGSGSSTTTSGSSGYDPSKRSGGTSGPSTGQIYLGSMADYGTGSGSNVVFSGGGGQRTNTPVLGTLGIEDIQKQFASSAVYSATTEITVPRTTSQEGSLRTRQTTTNQNYVFNVTSTANSLTGLINDINRYKNVKTRS